MMGMGSMDMNVMHGMEHGPGTSRKHNGGMDHPSGMSEPPQNSDTTMNHDRHSMKRMTPGSHTREADHDVARTGKKYGADFRLLAADVSASKNLAVDGMDPGRPWPPYANLRSTKPTAFPQDKPVREIRLTLDGDMERYVWFLNNKPLSESDSIRIREGEVVRFIMVNRTMMHHPMHLHGHFFRVINSQGDYSPLKHTVNVAPMSTTVIEFYTDEVGDWFFHCHLLLPLPPALPHEGRHGPGRALRRLSPRPPARRHPAQSLQGFLVFLGTGRCPEQHDRGLSDAIQHPQHPDRGVGSGVAGRRRYRVGGDLHMGSPHKPIFLHVRRC
jgi:hypothetical protein